MPLDERLEKRLDSIERRLLAIEQATAQRASSPQVAPPIVPAFKVELPPTPVTPSPAWQSAPRPEVPPAPTSPIRAESIENVVAQEAPDFSARKAAQQKYREEADRAWRERLEKVNSAPPIDWAKIESLIAGRWYALAGGLVVTFGVALFVQYAVRQGWLGQIPGWARCALGGMFGIALLCTGEWARRKVNEWASVGLTAAGLGSLYISSYAAYALYQLMSPGATLLILAGVAGIGLAISAATSLSAVGVVSMIGAYIAPFIASSGNAGYVYLPPYWLALLIVGQLLSVTKGGTFAMCRWLGAAATLLLGAGWITQFGAESPWIGLAMLAGTWVLFHVESVWTARRADRENLVEYSESDLAQILDSPEFPSKIQRLRLRPLVSVSASAWASSLGVYAARSSHVPPESLAPGVIGAFALVLACMLVGPSGILNPRPKTRLERLAAALCCTAGALLVATVAIALSGFAQTIALAAIGLAALGAGRWLRTQVLDIYSGLVLLFAAGRVLFYDSWATAPNAPGLELLGFYLTEWSAACAGIGIAWFVFAYAVSRVRELPDADAEHSNSDFVPHSWCQIAANFAVGLAIALLGASLLHQKAAHESVACAFIGVSLSYCFAGAFRRSFGLRITSIVALLVATVGTFSLGWWVRRPATELAGFMLVPQMLVAVANGLAALLIAWVTSKSSLKWATVSKGITGLAIACFVAAAFHSDSSASRMCYAWLIVCWACLGLARSARGFAFEAHALWVWLIVLATWGARFAANDWAASKSPPLLHPGLWIAFALAGTILAIRKVSKPILVGQEAKAKALAWWAATVLVWGSTSLEVARLSEMLPIDATARGAAVSIWWGIFAVLLLVVGFWRDEPLVRRCGLALLAIATAKALIFDLARVPAGWRSVSVVSLGLLMLGVNVVYARVAKRMLPAPTPPKDTDDLSGSESTEPG